MLGSKLRDYPHPALLFFIALGFIATGVFMIVLATGLAHHDSAVRILRHLAVAAFIAGGIASLLLALGFLIWSLTRAFDRADGQR